MVRLSKRPPFPAFFRVVDRVSGLPIAIAPSEKETTRIVKRLAPKQAIAVEGFLPILVEDEFGKRYGVLHYGYRAYEA